MFPNIVAGTISYRRLWRSLLKWNNIRQILCWKTFHAPKDKTLLCFNDSCMLHYLEQLVICFYQTSLSVALSGIPIVQNTGFTSPSVPERLPCQVDSKPYYVCFCQSQIIVPNSPRLVVCCRHWMDYRFRSLSHPNGSNILNLSLWTLPPQYLIVTQLSKYKGLIFVPPDTNKC